VLTSPPKNESESVFQTSNYDSIEKIYYAYKYDLLDTRYLNAEALQAIQDFAS
jgi:hypothetical protein